MWKRDVTTDNKLLCLVNLFNFKRTHRYFMELKKKKNGTRR